MSGDKTRNSEVENCRQVDLDLENSVSLQLYILHFCVAEIPSSLHR